MQKFMDQSHLILVEQPSCINAKEFLTLIFLKLKQLVPAKVTEVGHAQAH